MKTLYFFICFLFISANGIAQCQLFQNNLVELGVNGHYKDVNTVELQDGTGDMIIAGTKFTNGFNTKQLFLIRVEAIDGSRVWSYQYINIDVSRGFDVIRFQENGQERIAVTGYVNDGQLNRMYIAVIDASNGNVIRDESYDIGTNFNSQGLNIIYTEKNHNTVPTSGFVISGYINFNYDVNVSNNSSGFVMRTDLNLNPLWTKSSFSQTNANVDYDMMNDVTETNDGYFVTGSLNEANGSRQGIFIAKLDEQGDTLWTNSYLQGNFRDVGIDSYFDTVSNEIYLLTYYSNYHYFGITTIDNSTGSINLNKSWNYSNSNQLNRTGFKITSSVDPSTPDDLVIMGYEKEALVQDPTGPMIDANTLPFAISFDRNTGVVNSAITYIIPYQDNQAYTDYFRFWEGQSPLIYHPEIGFTTLGNSCHFMVANRSYGLNHSAIEMIKLDQSLTNYCLSDSFPVTENLINFQALTVTLNNETTNLIGISLAKQNNGIESQECESGGVLAIQQNNLDTIDIFPNPSNGKVFFKNNNSRIINSVIVYSVSGNKVFELNQNDIQSIDLFHFTIGMYFININYEDGTSVIEKMIKQ